MLGGSRRSSGVGEEETKAMQGRQQRHPPAQQKHSAVSSLPHPDLPSPKTLTTPGLRKGRRGHQTFCFYTVSSTITVVLDDEAWYVTVVLNKGMIKCSNKEVKNTSQHT